MSRKHRKRVRVARQGMEDRVEFDTWMRGYEPKAASGKIFKRLYLEWGKTFRSWASMQDYLRQNHAPLTLINAARQCWRLYKYKFRYEDEL